MSIAQKSSNHHFTHEARLAAQEARKRKALLMLDPNRPEVFVVRGIEDEHRFEWQIRRFGGVILDCSRTRYGTIQDAQVAGRQAMRVFSA